MTPIGTVVFRHDTYTETVIAASSQAELIECTDFGIVLLYRLECPTFTAMHGKAYYTHDTAMQAYEEVIPHCANCILPRRLYAIVDGCIVPTDKYSLLLQCDACREESGTWYGKTLAKLETHKKQ